MENLMGSILTVHSKNVKIFLRKKFAIYGKGLLLYLYSSKLGGYFCYQANHFGDNVYEKIILKSKIHFTRSVILLKQSVCSVLL